MNRRRISRNRLEGFKNVPRQPEKHYRVKLTFAEWVKGGQKYCESSGAATCILGDELFIEWPGKGITIRSVDDLKQEYNDEYCSQWRR